MTDSLDSAIVAQYLADHPHFFEEHANLLGDVRLSSPLTGRAVSLQERQMEVMRDKYKALELRMADLTRHAEANAAIANRFHSWNQAILQVRADGDVPHAVAQGLVESFNVPAATLRLFNVAGEFAGEWFASDVSEDARLFANSLMAPYCGSNNDFEAVRWLDDAQQVKSTVILPLRKPGGKGPAFGLLIMGSPDPERFTSLMATDFLVHIGETASVALAPLLA
ncbi:MULTISPECIES: DUF484 family protein [unclassified Duganella]|uniref:DUF484 family protein n=1 Tax=unclassified Duganella TaxID=2636909 RepID=UPI0006FF8C83|nr:MULTISPECIES: DUF484 family protein [unclassified Duganella]KQV55539.1 hypothetical protein ASD07_27725 [Duganella sp. Root336D2]KRC02604.1 hypothetical protein ASE26_19050 [Duganella sp. Root198D2]